MYRLRIVIEQLELSREEIEKGTEMSLRIALMLLDNVSEILMHRVVKSELSTSQFYEDLVRRWKEVSTSEGKREHSLRQLEPHVISKQRKRLLKFNFNEKAIFLAEKKRLTDDEMKSLIFIHKYRNELYHHEKIRNDSIEPVTKLLYSLVCDLFSKLNKGGFSWESTFDTDEKWKMFLDKYSIKLMNISPHKLKQISRALKKPMDISLKELHYLLRRNLENRIKECLSQIEFITEFANDAGEPSGNDDESNEIKKLMKAEHKPLFAAWDIKIQSLAVIKNKLALFNSFATIEEDFEKYELKIEGIAMEIDAFIQIRIDMLRGK